MSRLLSTYLISGFTYNLGRTYYYNGKMHENSTWYEDNKRKTLSHPILFKERVLNYIASIPLTLIWPLMALDDIDFHQKRKLGIESNPPPPFTANKYKD